MIACLFRYVAHSADYDLDDGASFLPQEMYFIDNYQCHMLHVGTMLPVTRDTIPLLRGGNEYISICEGLQIWCNVTCQLQHLLTQRSIFQTLFPVNDSLFSQCFQWCDVYNLGFGCMLEHSKHGHLGHYGLSGASWCPDQHIRVRVKQSMKYLGLHWVEEFDILRQIQLCEFFIAKR